jgi:hypothetical protein
VNPVVLRADLREAPRSGAWLARVRSAVLAVFAHREGGRDGEDATRRHESTHLTVYFSTTEPDVPLPFGADRALLAWVTTLTYDTAAAACMWFGTDETALEGSK